MTVASRIELHVAKMAYEIPQETCKPIIKQCLPTCSARKKSILPVRIRGDEKKNL